MATIQHASGTMFGDAEAAKRTNGTAVLTFNTRAMKSTATTIC